MSSSRRSGKVIPLLQKIEALLAGITRAKIEAMPPASRQWLAQALRRVADLCDPPAVTAPKAGVLADLHQGKRAD